VKEGTTDKDSVNFSMVELASVRSIGAFNVDRRRLGGAVDAAAAAGIGFPSTVLGDAQGFLSGDTRARVEELAANEKALRGIGASHSTSLGRKIAIDEVV
jgi:hypothetical protein